MSALEQLTEASAFHAEGPVWFAARQELRYVDMLAGDVHLLDVGSGEITRLHLAKVVAAVRPRERGGMVAALERGFALVDDDGAIHDLGELWSDRAIRMNDGGCDPEGRFYCGSMAYDLRQAAGTLYRLDVDGAVSQVLTGVTISNGIAWSPDQASVYYADTATHRVDVFSYTPERGLEARRAFVTVADDQGAPDGLTVDAEGCVWVALWGGSAVHRYQPDGKLDGRIELPVSQVTACTFGGPDLSDLFITTSRQEIPDGEQPEAGAIFKVRPGVSGLEVLPYKG